MKNKTLTIDCAKWRCGSISDISENRLGFGDTEMLNREGYMCCLGQLSLQLNKKLGNCSILKRYSPEDCGARIPILTDKNIRDTNLTFEAVTINDDEDTTVKEKIRLLRALFKKKNITLRFINQKAIK